MGNESAIENSNGAEYCLLSRELSCKWFKLSGYHDK